MEHCSVLSLEPSDRGKGIEHNVLVPSWLPNLTHTHTLYHTVNVQMHPLINTHTLLYEKRVGSIEDWYIASGVLTFSFVIMSSSFT